MSNESAENLNRKKIAQLLAGIGSQPENDDSQIEATEYNWNQPHCFSTDQLKKLNDFCKKAAAIATLKLNSLCQSDFTITIESTTQHFAEELFGQKSEADQNYYMAFNNKQEQSYGFISMPAKTSMAWTAQLLGEPGSKEDENKPLSLLEESLLSDVNFIIIESVSKSHDSLNLEPVKIIIQGQVPFYMEGTEELCKMTFGFQEGESDKNEFSVVMPCSNLESIAEKSEQTVETFSNNDILKAVTERLHKMSVNVTAQLACAVLTFEEIMGLQPDDIVLLDRKITEPIDVTAENQIIFHGQPAKSAGKYAVVITEVCNNSI